eukprot:7135914-Prymnesium_polylepis.1
MGTVLKSEIIFKCNHSPSCAIQRDPGLLVHLATALLHAEANTNGGAQDSSARWRCSSQLCAPSDPFAAWAPRRMPHHRAASVAAAVVEFAVAAA